MASVMLFAASPLQANPSAAPSKVLLGLETRDKIFAIDFRDKDHGVAIGDVGFIISTKDGGSTWTRYKDKKIGFEPLFDVCLVGAKSGWIVGKRGVILHTNDGGVTWEKQKSGTQNDLMTVKFINDKQGTAAGSYGTILQTNDGGVTWKPFTMNWEKDLKVVMEKNGLASPHLYDLSFANDKQGWIVGENGVVLLTGDGGQSWSLSQGGLLPPLFSIAFKSQSEAVAVGLNGYAVSTQDGKTWKKVDLGTKDNLFRIRMNKQYGFIVGEFGTVLTTLDGGKTWKARLEPDRETMIGIWMPDGSKEAVIAGAKTIRKLSVDEK